MLTILPVPKVTLNPNQLRLETLAQQVERGSPGPPWLRVKASLNKTLTLTECVYEWVLKWVYECVYEWVNVSHTLESSLGATG